MKALIKQVKAAIIAEGTFKAGNTFLSAGKFYQPGVTLPYCLVIPGGKDFSGQEGNVRREGISFTVSIFQEILDDIRQEQLIIDDVNGKGMFDLAEKMVSLLDMAFFTTVPKCQDVHIFATSQSAIDIRPTSEGRMLGAIDISFKTAVHKCAGS